MALIPSVTAQLIAVLPYLSFRLLSAPAWTSNLTQPSWLSAEALIKAVDPFTLVLASLLAPEMRRALTIESYPFEAALMRAVSPYWGDNVGCQPGYNGGYHLDSPWPWHPC